jgi:hypothetical protein
LSIPAHSRQISQHTIPISAYKLAERCPIAPKMGVDQAFVGVLH